jgi:hypothetical protein
MAYQATFIGPLLNEFAGPRDSATEGAGQDDTEVILKVSSG